jgi:uncharacterized protein HemY
MRARLQGGAHFSLVARALPAVGATSVAEQAPSLRMGLNQHRQGNARETKMSEEERENILIQRSRDYVREEKHWIQACGALEKSEVLCLFDNHAN